MKFKAHHQTAFWLVLSVALLSSLIPGGPVENRDFSHIHPGILGGFNVFLTILDLGSLVLAYFVFRRRPWAISLSFVAAVGFFGVYAIDLAQVFPRSPTPMSFALSFIEVLGMTVAIPLMFAARRALANTNQNVTRTRNSALRFATAAALAVIGVAIVWFATDAAMSGDDLRVQVHSLLN